MRGYRRAGFMAAVSGLLGAGALVGLIVAAAPASAGTVTAQCDSQASFDPNCLVKETVSTPLSFELQIVSSPSKLGVQFIWNVNCPVDGTDVNAHGIVDGITPVSYQLTIPVPDPASCEAQASATVANGDEITATIIATTATSPAPSPSPSPTPSMVRVSGGKCASTPGTSAAKRTKVVIRTCSATSPAETWKLHGGELIHNNMCANARGPVAKGSKVILWPCNGAANEIWTHKSNGEYVLKAGHGKLCLDDPRSSTVNGTQLIVYTCTNSRNQHWTLPGH